MHILIKIISLTLLIGLNTEARNLRSSLFCKVRNSTACKNLNTFMQDIRDNCADPKSNCRNKFCTHNCYGTKAPKDRATRSACYTYCDPQDFSVTLRERQIFKRRFEDKHSRRRKEVTDFIARVLSNQIWCESECDFEEDAPSCQYKKGKAKKHWEACASVCYFIKDIKAHADMCLNKLKIAPKPKLARQAQ